jgi:hypothetical protein
MARCQHCCSNKPGIQKDGHKFCRDCGRVKSGASLEKITVEANLYKHQSWTVPLVRELDGERVFFGEVADQLV